MTTIYLDICSLKRPFDDQGQARIRQEAHAIADILERVERGELEPVRSPAHLVENDANPREDRRLATALWLQAARPVSHDDRVEQRARALQALGFGVLDALHLAFSEEAHARWFITCDDRLARLARRHASELRVVVLSPCEVPLERGGPPS